MSERQRKKQKRAKRVVVGFGGLHLLDPAQTLTPRVLRRAEEKRLIDVSCELPLSDEGDRSFLDDSATIGSLAALVETWEGWVPFDDLCQRAPPSVHTQNGRGVSFLEKATPSSFAEPFKLFLWGVQDAALEAPLLNIVEEVARPEDSRGTGEEKTSAKVWRQTTKLLKEVSRRPFLSLPLPRAIVDGCCKSEGARPTTAATTEEREELSSVTAVELLSLPFAAAVVSKKGHKVTETLPRSGITNVPANADGQESDNEESVLFRRLDTAEKSAGKEEEDVVVPALKRRCGSLSSSHSLRQTVSSISCGSRHLVATLRATRGVYTFGENIRGQCGVGEPSVELISEWQLLLREKEIKSIAAGLWHSAAIDADGQLYTWGYNEDGQLLLGDFSPQFSPKAVEELFGVPLASVYAGRRHTVVLSMAGDVYLGGNNDWDQLSDCRANRVEEEQGATGEAKGEEASDATPPTTAEKDDQSPNRTASDKRRDCDANEDFEKGDPFPRLLEIPFDVVGGKCGRWSTLLLIDVPLE